MGSLVVTKPRRTLVAAVAVALAAGSSPWFVVSIQGASPYLLPVPSGTSVYVTQGNGQGDHVGSGQYAFDFGEAGNPEFPVVAARGGSVIGLRSDSTTSCANASCWTQANYILIDHGDKTSGLYMHLATGSVKVTLGETVVQGQPLANADSTGYSTNNHLHFQVETTPGTSVRSSAGWWWTQSTAIAFADPSVIAAYPDGVPKASFSTVLVSSNAFLAVQNPPPPANPPVLGGTWVAPANGATIKSTKVTLSAKPTASLANVNLTKVVYSVASGSAAARTACTATKGASDGTWSCTADLLKLGVPLGKLTLSFDVFDDAGDVTHGAGGARTVTYAVPPPAPMSPTARENDVICNGQLCNAFVLTWRETPGWATSFRIYIADSSGECLVPGCGPPPNPPCQMSTIKRVALVNAATRRWATVVPAATPFNCWFIAAVNASGASSIRYFNFGP